MIIHDGNVTIKVTGMEDDAGSSAASSGLATLLREMRADLEAVAAHAAKTWYREVHWRTGKSGRIVVVSSVSNGKMRVTVGSTDTREVRGGRSKGAPVAMVVHRPGPLSMRDTRVNSKAGDGKNMMSELVQKPVRKVVSTRLRAWSEALAKGTQEGLLHG